VTIKSSMVDLISITYTQKNRQVQNASLRYHSFADHSTTHSNLLPLHPATKPKA
jgi:hypothetical protein